MTVTVKEIQAKFSRGESHDSKVRKAWVLQMPEEQKAKFKKFPGDVRRQLYKGNDKEVFNKWIKLMDASNEKARTEGAKLVNIDGIKRFEDAYCVDTDQLLIQAAKEFIDEFIENFGDRQA